METSAWAWRYVAWIGVTLLVVVIVWELLHGALRAEGFVDVASRDVPAFFQRHMPRRVDVAPAPEGASGGEEPGWVRDTRYFAGYADVQGNGYTGDFCRVVQRADDAAGASRMMACALAGTEGSDSLVYRTGSSRAGVAFSRDDYFADVTGSGKAAYCRVLKVVGPPTDAWAARCVLPGLAAFVPPHGVSGSSTAVEAAPPPPGVGIAGASLPLEPTEVVDAAPPSHIAYILDAFAGCMMWLRLIDDVTDYAGNVRVALAGGATVDQVPPKRAPDGTCEGLRINAVAPGDASGSPPSMNQFASLGEVGVPSLAFTTAVRLRDVRAIMVWVRFDTFGHNATIIDFGNGMNDGNLLLKLDGDGNAAGAADGDTSGTGAPQGADVRADSAPSDAPFGGGAACAPTAIEVSPQELLLTPVVAPPLIPPAVLSRGGANPRGPLSAGLMFQVWDATQKLMDVRVPSAVVLGAWTHIALSVDDASSTAPTWYVYINGALAYTQPGGALSTTVASTRTYLGRSNLEAETANYAQPDVRLSGALFDVRLYRVATSAALVQRTVAWGRPWLRPPSGGWPSLVDTTAPARPSEAIAKNAAEP